MNFSDPLKKGRQKLAVMRLLINLKLIFKFNNFTFTI